MGREHTYYFDYRGADSITLYRWYLIPAGEDAHAQAVEPEWGEDPDIVGGSTFRRIPDGVIVEAETNEGSKYDIIPVGLPQQMSKSIRVRPRHCAGSTELNELRSYLKIYEIEHEVETITGTTRALNVSNQWILKRGAQTWSGGEMTPGAIGTFTMEFHGVQVEREKRKWDPTPGQDAEFTTNIQHIGEATLQSTTWAMITDVLLSDDYDPQVTRYLWDWFWPGTAGGAHNHAWSIATWWSTYQAPNISFQMWTWRQIARAMQEISNKVFHVLSRRHEPEELHYRWRGRNEDHQGAGTYASCPIEYVGNYEHAYDAAGTAGDELFAGNKYQAGLVVWASQDEYGLTDGMIVDGVLEEKSNMSWWKFENLWNWANSLAKSCDVRGQIRITGAGMIDLWWHGSLDAVTTHDLPRSNIAELKQFEEFSGIIETAKGEILGAIGEDMKIGEAKNTNLKITGRSFVWKQMIEVIPTIGDATDFKSFVRGRTDFPSDTPWDIFGSRDYVESIWSKIYYQEGTGGSSAPDYPVWFRVHHKVKIYNTADGASSDVYDYTLPVALPDVEYKDYDEWGEKTFTPRVRAINLDIGQHASLAQRIAERYISRFSSANVTSYPMVLNPGVANVHNLGDIFRFTPINGAQYDASAYVGLLGDDTLTHLPGVCYLTECKPDDTTGKTEVVLLGVRQT